MTVSEAPATTMTWESYTWLTQHLHRRTGLVLEAGQMPFAEARLRPLAAAHGYASVADLVGAIRGGAHRRLCDQVHEALAVGATGFFCDTRPYACLRDVVLPRLIARRAAGRTLSIWSAGCSTGQEAYTIALLLADAFPELRNWSVRILATDLSRTALEQARAGAYARDEVERGLPAKRLGEAFVEVRGIWYIRDGFQRSVEFRQLNLVDPWPALPPMDLVLLRHVLASFSAAARSIVLDRVRRQILPDGLLMVAESEHLLPPANLFQPETDGLGWVFRPIPPAVEPGGAG